MKRIIVILIVSIFFYSCGTTKSLNNKEKTIINQLITRRIIEKNTNNFPIFKNTIKKQDFKNKIDNYITFTIKRGKEEREKVKKDVLNKKNIEHFYSNFEDSFIWKADMFIPKQVKLVDSFNGSNIEELKKQGAQGAKTYSKPLFSIDKEYAIIMESSIHAGQIIFIFEKKENKWVEYNRIY